ncbi:hypothetical protein PV04_02631 [Phialophora macrospora]|uniref:Uncharacterized protein n=1 Tax=Phialophora macrospora TaxID=1851006 RepID=A0A0D2CYR3_9EURO|nr:hypothetical protein PV04_02631 [Phialophora macrospora]
MPDFLRVAGGVAAKDGVAESEAAQFEALKRGVLAEKARKEQEERERRISQGLPAELTAEEKRERKRQEKMRRGEEKQKRRAGLETDRGSGGQKGGGTGSRVLGMLCFGAR